MICPGVLFLLLMLNAAIIRLGIGEGKDKKVMSGCQEVSRKSESDRKQLRPTPHCVNGLSYLAQTWLLSESWSEITSVSPSQVLI